MLNLRTPGVYIQEIPSGVRTIAAVSTSNTGFIGYFAQGPANRATRISSFSDFQRIFGGLNADSPASYAVQQFYLNGGATAYIVRVHDGAVNASRIINDDTPTQMFTLLAENPGTWGNRLQFQIEHAPAPNTNNEFTLTVRVVNDLTAQRPTELVRETHRNLTVATIVRTLQTDSNLVRATLPGAPSTSIPVVTAGLENLVAASLVLVDGVPDDLFLVNALDNSAAGVDVAVAISAVTASDFTLMVSNTGPAPTPPDEVFANLTPASAATIVNRDSRRIRLTHIDPTSTAVPVALAATNLVASGTPGTNGNIPGSVAWDGNAAPLLEGSSANPLAKTGMHSLEDIAPEIFNILCIPDAASIGDAGAQAVYAAANQFCIDHRSFLLIDIPEAVDTPAEILNWTPLASLRSDHAAIYFPRIEIPDPLNSNRPRNIPNSGTLAGLYSRTDSQRGVWKAPAGADLPLRNTTLAARLTDPENGEVNPLGINALRVLPIYGNVSWGARTLFGENARAHEYGYVPVRRMALFIEESLFQGLQWVVFEPNDEKLWSQIRINVTGFMQSLFKKGAFAGLNPRQAYLVKCDSETTTPTDVNLGIVNIVVGFAPLKPAEFVIIQLQQLTQIGE